MDFEKIKNIVKEEMAGRGVSDYEVYAVESDIITAESRHLAIEALKKANEHYLSIRIFKDGKAGFSYLSDLSSDAIKKGVEFASAALSPVAYDPFNTLPNLAGTSFKPSSKEDKGLGKIPIEERVERARSLEDFARRYDRRIVNVRSARYAEESYRVYIFNSRGVERYHSGTLFHISLLAVASEHGLQETGGSVGYSHLLNDLDVSGVAEEASERALELLGARPISSHKCPAVFDRGVASAFLAVLAPSFLGDNVIKGRSFLKEKLGQKVYSPAVNLVDDGLLPGGFFTSPFDGEGVARSRRLVVEKGVVSGFLYDHRSGLKSKKGSTGNSVRGSFKEPPQVGTTNFYLEPGDADEETVIGEMGEGFFVRDVIGMHTANQITGDFSVGAAGHWMEKGRPKSPVRGVMISGNLHELFGSIDRVCSNQHFYGPIGSPSFRVTEISVGGK